MATFEVIRAANIGGGGGGSSLFPVTGTGTASGDVAGDLDGHNLSILSGATTYLGVNILDNIVSIGADRFTVISSDGNLLDVDFGNSANSITLLINEAQNGLNIGGGPGPSVSLNSAFGDTWLGGINNANDTYIHIDDNAQTVAITAANGFSTDGGTTFYTWGAVGAGTTTPDSLITVTIGGASYSIPCKAN